MVKKKVKEKYKPDEVATLITDLKRAGIWITVSVALVVACAYVIENIL